MKIGMSLPQLGPQASAESLIAIARRAEELGYDSLWVLERLLWPLNPAAVSSCVGLVSTVACKAHPPTLGGSWCNEQPCRRTTWS